MDLSITHMRPSFLDHSLSVHVSVWRSGCSHERQVAHRVQLWRDRHAGAPINLFSPSAAIIWRRQRCAARAKQEILCLYMLPDYPCYCLAYQESGCLTLVILGLTFLIIAWCVVSWYLVGVPP